MTAWLLAGSWLVATLGLALGGLVLALTRRIKPALGVLLDFLLAAGLLRLSLAGTWTAIASAGMLVVIRKVVVLGLDSVAESRTASRRLISPGG